MIYYLYVKTHNQTGLKYLGKTTKDPYKYKGSGKYWIRHLQVYGNDMDTSIIGTYNDKEELKEAGLYYSKVWNIVESNEWANLKIEEGDGGFALIGENHPMKRPEQRERMRRNNPSKYLGEAHPSKRAVFREKMKKNNPMKRPEIAVKRSGDNHHMKRLEVIIKYSKDWIVFSPQNENIKIRNLAKFCRDNNLNPSHMIEIANGRRKQHKGWKCEYA